MSCLDPDSVSRVRQFPEVGSVGYRNRFLLSYAESVLKINPSSSEAYILQANALLALGRVDQAVEAIKTAVSINPKSPDLQYMTAEIMFRYRTSEQAMAYFAAAVNLAPREPSYAAGYARCLSLSGRVDRGIFYAKVAHALRPSEAEYSELLSDLLAALNLPGDIAQIRRTDVENSAHNLTNCEQPAVNAKTSPSDSGV